MKKPLVLAKEDFMTQLKGIINNCELPIIVLEPIMKSVYDEVRSAYIKHYNEEKEKYELETKTSED